VTRNRNGVNSPASGRPAIEGACELQDLSTVNGLGKPCLKTAVSLKPAYRMEYKSVFVRIIKIVLSCAIRAEQTHYSLMGEPSY
jgi:hypothetical protein